MYARIFEGSLRTGLRYETIDYFRQSIAPALRQQAGFLDGRLLSSRSTSYCQVITVWESEADCGQADTDGFLQTLFGHLSQYFVDPVRSRVYEVSVQVNSS